MGKLNDLLSTLIGKVNSSVKTEAQTLDDAQKAQARANIGAVKTWDEVEGKPFDLVFTMSDTLTWDGASVYDILVEKESSDILYYRVSPSVPSYDEILNNTTVTIRFPASGEETTVNANDDLVKGDGFIAISELVIVVTRPGVTINDYTFPKTGTYFVWFSDQLYVSAMTISNFATEGIGEGLLPPYLPKHFHNWNTIKGTPFVGTYIDTVTFDGDVTKADTAVAVDGGVLYCIKVSDRIPAVADLSGKTITIAVYENGTVTTYTENGDDAVSGKTDGDLITLMDSMVCCVPTDYYAFLGAYLSKGTYFVAVEASSGSAWVRSITIPGVNIFPSGEILDEKYLPTTVPAISSATVGQAIVVKAVDADGRPTDWEAQNIPTELPEVTADNNGAFLRVVDGAWVVAALTDVSTEGA